jgi:putative NIF3 family GTP cyclohydrolase 1 type 2
MQRRTFIKNVSIASVAMFPLPTELFVQKNITVAEVQRYLRSMVTVDEPSTDRIIVGDGNTQVLKIGTCWTPHWDICKKAVADGVNLLIAHEPTFYTHWDLDATDQDYLSQSSTAKADYLKQRAAKLAWLQEKNLSIIRCHDVMDKLGEFGMPFALGQLMGLDNSQIIRSKPYYNVYQITSTTASKCAKNIAKNLKNVGQQGVAFYGDPKRKVSTIGVGCGYLCDPLLFADLQPDLYVVINDTIKTWIQGSYSIDSGQPMVVIDHGTAEEHGMVLLCNHLSQTFPNLICQHYKGGCSFTWISA